MALVVDMTTSKHIATTVHTHTYWRGSDDSGDDSSGCTKLITTTDAHTHTSTTSAQLHSLHLTRTAAATALQTARVRPRSITRASVTPRRRRCRRAVVGSVTSRSYLLH